MTGKVKSRPYVNELLSMMSAKTSTNNLKDFKKFVENEKAGILDKTTAVQYQYDSNLNIYNNNANSDSYVQTSPNQIMTNLGMGDMEQMQSMYAGAMASNEVWTKMLDNQNLLESQYDLLEGKWPEKYNEVVLIVDKDNRISDFTLYSLGLLDPDELAENYKKLLKRRKSRRIRRKSI